MPKGGVEFGRLALSSALGKLTDGADVITCSSEDVEEASHFLKEFTEAMYEKDDGAADILD